MRNVHKYILTKQVKNKINKKKKIHASAWFGRAHNPMQSHSVRKRYVKYKNK